MHFPVGIHFGDCCRAIDVHIPESIFLQTDNHAAFRVDRHDVDAFGQLQNLVVGLDGIDGYTERRSNLAEAGTVCPEL